jgi:RNA polymerase sigma factor (sigma-70 family)
VGGGEPSLSDSLQIPIYTEYLRLVGGSHELAVILNQLVFLSAAMPRLAVKTVKRYTRSNRNHATVRDKLNQLMDLGLVERTQSGTLYNAYLYSAKPNIYPKDAKAAAIVEGRDMRVVDTYVEAEMINRLRLLAKDDKKSIRYSARELGELISTDRCSETIRLKIKNLVKLNYLTPRLVGRVYEYDLNTKGLLSPLSPEVVEAQGGRLTELFVKHCKVYLNKTPSSADIASWKQTFKGMLLEGVEYRDVMHVAAYLPYADPTILSAFDSPAVIKRNFTSIHDEAVKKLSKRRARKHLSALLKGLKLSIGVKKAKAEAADRVETAAEIEVKRAEAAYIEEWLAELYKVKTNRGNWFEFWADKLQINTNGFDEDEVKSLAQLHMLEYYRNYIKGIKKKPGYSRNSYLIYAIRKEVDSKFRAQNEYKKALFENIGGEDVFGEERSIEDFGDVKIEEFVQLHLAEDDADVKLRDAIFSALKQLSDDRERGVIIDYHGLNGVKLTQREIAEKYNCSHSWINKIIHKVYSKLEGLLIKDDEVRIRLRLDDEANAPP